MELDELGFVILLPQADWMWDCTIHVWLLPYLQIIESETSKTCTVIKTIQYEEKKYSFF